MSGEVGSASSREERGGRQGGAKGDRNQMWRYQDDGRLFR